MIYFSQSKKSHSILYSVSYASFFKPIETSLAGGGKRKNAGERGKHKNSNLAMSLLHYVLSFILALENHRDQLKI
jgi:hypothetical protein